jgi:hypothetical protein
MSEGLLFYVSKNHSRLNGRPFRPEIHSDYLCLNPLYNTTIEHPVNVLTDSGAFQDVDTANRLTFEDALDRQLQYEKKVGYVSEYLVSYDRLVDEQLIEGSKQKQRWEYDAAEQAVIETVGAAEYLAERRQQLAPRKLILSCQGVTIEQYVRCAKQIIRIMDKQDCFGFGGFCIIGQRRFSITPDGCTFPEQFARIVEQVMPMLQTAGIKRAHVFGVSYLPALKQAYPIALRHGIQFSTDTSSIERNSVIEGKVWSDEGFRQKLGREWKYTGPDPIPAGHWHPNVLAHENISRAVRTFRNLKGEARWRTQEQLLLF